jgi:hypothetical protein
MHGKAPGIEGQEFCWSAWRSILGPGRPAASPSAAGPGAPAVRGSRPGRRSCAPCRARNWRACRRPGSASSTGAPSAPGPGASRRRPAWSGAAAWAACAGAGCDPGSGSGRESISASSAAGATAATGPTCSGTRRGGGHDRRSERREGQGGHGKCRVASKKANRKVGLWKELVRDYCSRDMTIDDMLLVCFSMAVEACSSIWFEVMSALSEAKSTSMMRPVAALVLVVMFCRLL